MKPLILAFKLILPVTFFGYAALGNIAIFQDDGLALSTDKVMNGALTAELDALYRENLPHRQPSIGLVGAARYALLGEGRDGVVAGRDNWLFTAEEFRFAAEAPVGIGETAARMAEIRDQLAANGTRLVVVPLPAKVDIERARLGGDPASRTSAAEYDAFLAFLAQHGIETVDTRQAIIALDPARQAFLRTDTHWTPQGAAAVAEGVAQSGLILQGETIYAAEDMAPVTFQGDLVSFITSETLAPAIGLMPETVTPYLAVTEGDGAVSLFGEATAPAVLIGTSYSANENWSFAEALKLSLRFDILNLAQEGAGPVVPMVEYLKSGEPAPQLVIWEFPIRYLADPKLWPAEEEAENA